MNTIKTRLSLIAGLSVSLLASTAHATAVPNVAAVQTVAGGEAGMLALLSLSVMGAIWLARRKRR